MAITTRKQMRMEIENYKNLVFERLEGRDIQEAVFELINKAQDAIIDDVGMFYGGEVDDEDDQMKVFDIVAEQLTKAYFSGKQELPPTIDDI